MKVEVLNTSAGCKKAKFTVTREGKIRLKLPVGTDYSTERKFILLAEYIALKLGDISRTYRGNCELDAKHVKMKNDSKNIEITVAFPVADSYVLELGV